MHRSSPLAASRRSTTPSSAPSTTGHAQVEAVHLLKALLFQPEGIVGPLLQGAGVEPRSVAEATEAELDRLPAASGATVGAPSYSRAALQVLSRSADIAAEMKDDFVSTEHLLIALATVESPARTVLTDAGATGRVAARRADDGARVAAGHHAGPRVDLPGAGEVRRRPDRRRPRGQARPGDRAGLRDPPRGPGAVPAHQEQPGADRRARRRQDRRRRGAGPAGGRQRRARLPQGPQRALARPGRDGRRREVPRRVRGAAQGRAAGDQGLRGPGHHLHRRAAHRGRQRVPAATPRWTPATCSSRCWRAASCA